MFGIAFKYDDNWIRDNYDSYPNNKELWMAYNLQFGTDYKYTTFKSHLNRELKVGNRNDAILYTKEQEQCLKRWYKKYGIKKTTELFNKKFGSNKTEHVLKVKCKKMGCLVNEDVRKNHHRENLSKQNREHKLWDIWLGADGFLHIKVSNEPYVSQHITCPRLHRYVWEQANGKIPKGQKIIFLDNDITNCSLENLACVPSSYLALMNTYNMRSDCREITKTSVKWCELRMRLKKEGIDIGDDN